jgi:hypothetical protein
MKQLLCLVACFFLVSCSTTQQNNYVRVTGEGKTQEQAKENAFREAIQIRVGTVILSERESTLKSLQENINVYSAGYVDDYKIVSVIKAFNKVIVTVDVLVADSKLVNHRLNTGKTTNQIQGSRANTNYISFIDQKKNADKLVNTLLKTYPETAFILQQKPYTVGVDSYRNILLQVPYKLTWNYNFIVSLNETLDLIQDNNYGFLQQAPSNVITMAKNPKNLVLGERNHYKFNDIPLLHNMAQKIDNQSLRLLMQLYDDSNNIVYQGCWSTYSTFYSTGVPGTITVFGNTQEEGVLQLKITSEYNRVLQQSTNIKVSVVSKNKC